ncbi:hypothetical protein QFZ33_001450 [Arthrobacter globiformis]|nr:hypothetical protein [Arthrobacter globiformis]
MTDPDAGARARWAKAAARADGLTDLGISGAVRRYYAVYFPVLVGVGLGLGFFPLSLGADLAQRRDDSGHRALDPAVPPNGSLPDRDG